jgi:nucleoid-associated protein YgaU
MFVPNDRKDFLILEDDAYGRKKYFQPYVGGGRMKRSLLRAVSTFFALCILQIHGQGCSSDQQQLEDPLLVEDGEVEGEEAANENFGNENVSNENLGNENFGNENFANENLGGENLAGDQFSQGNIAGLNEGVGQNFANDQFNSLGGENPLLANEVQSNNDLENIIEEINNASQGDEGQVNLVANQAVADVGQVAETNQAVNASQVAGTEGANTTLVGTPLAPGLPELGSKMSYIVQPGDTLVAIAQKIYGDGNQWTEIANFTGLANPRLIYPGDVVYYQLTQQTQGFASAYEAAPRSEIQVQSGDTLSTIAGRVLGDPSLWKMIWRQNDNIDNPDLLTAGTTIFYVDQGVIGSAVEIFKNHFQGNGQVAVKSNVKADDLELTAFDTSLDNIDLDQDLSDSINAITAETTQHGINIDASHDHSTKRVI